MFSQLIASRPARRRSPAGFAGSLVLHGILLTGAVIATSNGPARRPPLTPQVVLPVFRPVAKPPAVAPAPVRARARSPLPVTPSIINVPIDVPDFIPPFDPLRAIINTSQPMVFRVGTPTRAGNPGPDAPSITTVLLGDQVEFPVVLDRRSPLPRFPQLLKSAGVEGVARLRFVVDTLGRVELGSVEVLESTHPAFALAVQAILPRMRFSPARVGGHAVRQLVEFPVQFRLDK